MNSALTAVTLVLACTLPACSSETTGDDLQGVASVIDGDTYLKADASWFRSIVSGVVRDQRKLDPLIGTALQDDWALSRLDSTVRAILRAGTFELVERKDVPVAVIVTEYVEIARAFFEDDEPKLVNAVLDRIARQIRTDVRT